MSTNIVGAGAKNEAFLSDGERSFLIGSAFVITVVVTYIFQSLGYALGVGAALLVMGFIASNLFEDKPALPNQAIEVKPIQERKILQKKQREETPPADEIEVTIPEGWIWVDDNSEHGTEVNIELEFDSATIAGDSNAAYITEALDLPEKTVIICPGLKALRYDNPIKIYPDLGRFGHARGKTLLPKGTQILVPGRKCLTLDAQSFLAIKQ